MTEHGRGAWNAAGVGGTKQYKNADQPGAYYYLGSGANKSTPNEFAVFRAVVAYQKAVNRRTDGPRIAEDGLYGTQTAEAVFAFQTKNEALTGAPWGGIGPQTSTALLLPDLSNAMGSAQHNNITLNLVGNTVRHESMWDAGAVGYVDNRDLGLAQINGAAHPDLTARKRLMPRVAFRFIIRYYDNALKTFDDLEVAVASYNLGIGGARSWQKAGKPDLWTVAGSQRNMRTYVDNIIGT